MDGKIKAADLKALEKVAMKDRAKEVKTKECPDTKLCERNKIGDDIVFACAAKAAPEVTCKGNLACVCDGEAKKDCNGMDGDTVLISGATGAHGSMAAIFVAVLSVLLTNK